MTTDTGKQPITFEEATSPTTREPSAEVQAWHDEQTRLAIKEADAGKFVTDEQLKAIVRKYVPHA